MPTKAKIPFDIEPSTLATPILNSQTEIYQERRKSLLDELRCISGIPNIINTLNRGEVYKLVCQPEGAKLFEDSAGNIKGVFYKDGKILEHAKFNAISPSIIKAASVIGSQILLVSIAMQLNRIENGISEIMEDLHNDRLSEIRGAMNLYQQASNVSNSETRSQLFVETISILNPGLEKSITALKKNIENAPSAQVGFFDNWGENQSMKALKKFKKIDESFICCLWGIKTLSECYVALGEPNVGTNALRTYLDKLNTSGIETAVEKSRIIPYNTEGKLIEQRLNSYLINKDSFKNSIQQSKNLADNKFNAIEIEFKPEEL